MKKHIELRKIIKENIVAFLKEKQDEESGLGKRDRSLGLKKVRVVIDGSKVKDNKDKVLAVIKKHDSESNAEFFEKTGKIVGTIAKSKLDLIKRDLKSIDPSASAKEKDQKLS